ncbi:DUF2993 domain-containing protein [Mycobacterium gastri]|uniref:DUF2993 domain-containing protein n=1 Tax=Mycobacterium gastri TaxID=1777 RepID=A0A1X1VAK5_MYCGS|nr:DUF2993 domain-containing protein [Mycobacterium gastri]ORV66085.1 hypothetical protein AWC07_11970 [Mycobacterium gastri]
MTNPQGPPSEGPSTWSRPGNPGPLGRPPAPTDPSGGQLRPGGPGGTHAQDPATQAGPGAGQATQPTEHLAAASAGAQRPAPPPAAAAATRTTPLAKPQEDAESGKPQRKRRWRRDPLSIFLILIIVFSLVVAGLIGAELYVRHEANSKIAEAVACEVKDKASASFGVAPLVLWQLATKHFTNISAETAGNQVRDAKGMKLQINIRDVQLRDTPNSQGTVGALDATVTWTSEGIKESFQNAIPVLGPFVSNTVTTHPRDGTVEMKGFLDNIVVKPQVTGNGLQLSIVTFNALGFTLPKESVQSMLDDFFSKLTKDFPLGIHWDTVQVTDNGVAAHLSTRNATIPAGGEQDPCFANL